LLRQFGAGTGLFVEIFYGFAYLGVDFLLRGSRRDGSEDQKQSRNNGTHFVCLNATNRESTLARWRSPATGKLSAENVFLPAKPTGVFTKQLNSCHVFAVMQI
jgi:hypothetical protein